MTTPCIQEANVARLQTNQENLMKEVQEIKSDVKDIKIQIAEMIEKLDTKFASKWVEWVVKGLIAIVLLAVFGALLKGLVL